MKLLLPLSLLALSSGAALATGLDQPLESDSPVAAQDSTQDFRQKFRVALEARATKEMENLVRSRKDDAVQAVLTVCEAISESGNESLDNEIQGLRKAWKATHGTPFVDRQYEFFSLISPSFKRTRRELVDAYTKVYPIFEKARTEENGPTLAECADQLTSQAKAFQQVGDNYMASLAWYFTAQSVDQQYRGEDADLFRACDAWELSHQTREKAGLKDAIHLWAKERAEELIKAGFADPESAKEVAAATEAAARASAITLAPTFELFDDLAAVQRPHYSADDVYQMWEQIYLQGNGSSKKIQTMPDSPDILREGAAKASVDLNGDGAGDVEIPITGNITPVRFMIGEGDAEREVAFLATIGRSDDTYQGFRQNLGPDENNMGIFFAPAGSVVADLAGTPVRIFDDNLDGIYGSLGENVKTWGYLGCRDGSFQPEMDSIQLGNAKKALPFSELIQVGDVWYRMQVEENGKRILAMPAGEVQTGTLKLKLKGVKADYLVLKGIGSNENVFIDVTANGAKGVEVPAGTYALFAGRVSKGKRQQVMKALVLPGKSMKNFVVKADETTELEFGAPFGFEFEFTQDDESVAVAGTSIVVVGQAGETYQRLWNCVPIVDVLARKVGSKKGVELDSMRPSQSQEEMSDNGWQTAWFPIAIPIEKGKLADHDVEVQLYQKKNKFFGKIESEWKE